jgi:FkbM family methyltransferase
VAQSYSGPNFPLQALVLWRSRSFDKLAVHSAPPQSQELTTGEGCGLREKKGARVNLKAPIQRLSRLQSVRRLYVRLSIAPLVGPALRRLVRRVIPSETRVWFQISDGLAKGLWVNLDPRYETSYVEGRYETVIQSALSQYLASGSVFYDIGAHIGVVSMYAAQLVGVHGRVFAFEAAPENASRLQEHLTRNNLPQIRMIGCAIWSSRGRVRFERAPAQSSRNGGAVTTQTTTERNDTIEIDAVALDDFARENPLPTVIKIDVEGAEADVLRGSEEVFRRAKPVLICEVHNDDAKANVTRWLEERNYQFDWLEHTLQFPRHLLATPRP